MPFYQGVIWGLQNTEDFFIGTSLAQKSPFHLDYAYAGVVNAVWLEGPWHWDVSGMTYRLLLMSRTIEWRLRFSSHLYWPLEWEPEWPTKLSAMAFSSLRYPSSSHIYDGWLMLPCRWVYGHRTHLSVLIQHTSLFFCLPYLPHLPFCLP